MEVSNVQNGERRQHHGVDREHAEDDQRREHAERPQRDQRRQGGGAEGGGGREGRDKDGVERSAHRVLDPVRQRSGLVLGPQLVYALVEGVHEHKHIVGADAHHHEDDEEVDELEERDLEHHAEPEKRNKDGSHSHHHRRRADDDGSGVVGDVCHDAEKGENSPVEVLVAQREPLVLLARERPPVHLHLAIRGGRHCLRLEAALRPSLLHAEPFLQRVARRE
mmetsp:Transcript_5363/g.21946  ORF Transcript_5363/g.21946 Transcript_5363/m.21946 type:complete len:222 (+) Transcript_5363:1661-2326(+)